MATGKPWYLTDLGWLQRYRGAETWGGDGGVTDSICLPSASRIRNTLFLFEISSFICWCISKRSENRKRFLRKNKHLDTHKTHEIFYGINKSLNLNQKQNKLELMLQRKQNMTFSTQLVISLTYSNLESIFTINKQFNKIIHCTY